MTLETYTKVRNVRANPDASLVVPFPHRVLSFVPAPCVTFRGRAEIVPFTDGDARRAFEEHRVLRDNIAWSEDLEPVFLKLVPKAKVLCHGLGISLMQMRRDHTGGAYLAHIPPERLASHQAAWMDSRLTGQPVAGVEHRTSLLPGSELSPVVGPLLAFGTVGEQAVTGRTGFGLTHIEGPALFSTPRQDWPGPGRLHRRCTP